MSRLQGDDIPRKLRLVNCFMARPLRRREPIDAFDKDEIDKLAEAEHARFNAERLRRGWRLGSSRSPTKRRSPSLVAWSKLTDEEKSLDISAVNAILPALKAENWYVYRVGECAIDASAGHMLHGCCGREAARLPERPSQHSDWWQPPDRPLRPVLGDRGAGRALGAFSRSSKRCSTVKKDGTNSTARQVEAIMPLNTQMPSETRAAAPAPVAVTSGTTPRMNANEVIRIGRKR